MIWRILLIVAIGYATVVLLAWLLQARLVYLPQVPGREWDATPADAGLGYEDVAITTADGVELSAWFVPAATPRATILFFHGNAGNISHRLETIANFHELGLSVLILDYRGYGRSEGQPSETGTRRDARAAWRYLQETRSIPPAEIVLAGRSLGAAVAAELAAELAAKPAALILEAPFTSLPAIAQQAYPLLPARWLVRGQYATRARVAAVPVPVLVIHGRDDAIIPIEQGRAVFEAARGPKRLLAVAGGHNDAYIRSRETYIAGVDRFLTEIAGLPGPG